jgi:type VI secretion system protein ImpF
MPTSPTLLPHMPKSVSGEEPLLPSLLDRLLDDEPEARQEPSWRQASVIRSIRDGLCRDLQNLLNARRSLSALPDRYSELPTSLVNYGLPDLQSREIRDDHQFTRLAVLIEEAIRSFEPRLQGVRVTRVVAGDDTREADRHVRFEIEAVLVVEPLRESVFFSSSLDVTSGEFDVKGET